MIYVISIWFHATLLFLYSTMMSQYGFQSDFHRTCNCYWSIINNSSIVCLLRVGIFFRKTVRWRCSNKKIEKCIIIKRTLICHWKLLCCFLNFSPIVQILFSFHLRHFQNRVFVCIINCPLLFVFSQKCSK